MVKKILASAVLGGVLTLGAAGMAGASTTTTTTPPRCAKAPAALARITKLEAKGNTYLAKATQREAAATADGHPKEAARIEKRIKRVQRLEAKGTALEKKIEAHCPGTTAAATGSSSDG